MPLLNIGDIYLNVEENTWYKVYDIKSTLYAVDELANPHGYISMSIKHIDESIIKGERILCKKTRAKLKMKKYLNE